MAWVRQVYNPQHLRELSRLLRREPEWFLYGDEEPAAATDELDGEVADRLDRIEQAQAEQAELLRELVSRLRRDDEEASP